MEFETNQKNSISFVNLRIIEKISFSPQDDEYY